MNSDAWPLSEAAEQPAASVRATSPTVLPASVRLRVFLFLGILVALVAVGSPSGPMFETALSLLLKNQLQLSASEVSDFRALVAIPIYLSAIFGFIRDSWNPFGIRDRGLILLFGGLTVVLYIVLAFVPVTYATLLDAVLLLRVSFRLVSSAENGLLSTFAQQHTMSGQISAECCLVDDRRHGIASRRPAQRSAQVGQRRSHLPHPVFGMRGGGGRAGAVCMVETRCGVRQCPP
jgi:hypothetical protein